MHLVSLSQTPTTQKVGERRVIVHKARKSCEHHNYYVSQLKALAASASDHKSMSTPFRERVG